MKKILMILVMAVCALTSVTAATSQSDVDSYKNSLVNYICEEGYVPSIDSDGDIKFKKEGKTYFVSIDSYDNGYYVKIFRMLDTEGYTKAAVLNACNETMIAYKYVRCYATKGDTLFVECNIFCSTLVEFKLMFDNALSVIQFAVDKIIEGI